MTTPWTVLIRELAEPDVAVARLHLLNPTGPIALVADPGLTDLALTDPVRRGGPLWWGGGVAARVIDLALVGSVGQVLDNIRNWIIGILAGLATVFLTIGGARYVMAGGDPAEVERARMALRSAAFGYALAALAPLIVQVLKNIVGA
jgi:hypothetical protein